MYIEALFKNGLIPENKFSFFFRDQGNKSWVDFGEPKLDNVHDDVEFAVTQLIEKDYFWAAYSQGVAFRDTNPENSFSFQQIE